MELARHLLQKGARCVYNLDVAECAEKRENFHFVRCDVSAPAQVDAALAAIPCDITVLFNNAGIHSHGKRLTELSVREIEAYACTSAHF